MNTEWTVEIFIGRKAMRMNDERPDLKTAGDFQREAERAYEEWSAGLVATPELRALCEEEASKKALWLQLVESRLAAGLTQAEMAERLGVSQAQVTRIEKRGYDACSLSTLRRYVRALGGRFELSVEIRPISAVDDHPALVPGDSATPDVFTV